MHLSAVYCKTQNFRMPFILRISRSQQIHENKGRKYSDSNLVCCITSSSASKNAKIKGSQN